MDCDTINLEDEITNLLDEVIDTQDLLSESGVASDDLMDLTSSQNVDPGGGCRRLESMGFKPLPNNVCHVGVQGSYSTSLVIAELQTSDDESDVPSTPPAKRTRRSDVDEHATLWKFFKASEGNGTASSICGN